MGDLGDEVTVHGLGLLTHESTVLAGALLPGVHNTSQATKASLVLAVVGGHQVDKSVGLGGEGELGSLEGTLGSSGGTGEGTTLASLDSGLGGAGGVDPLVELLGSGGEGLGGGLTVGGLATTEHSEGEASALGESSDLLGSGGLGTDGGDVLHRLGEADIGESGTLGDLVV